MIIWGYRFQPKLWALIITLIFVAVFISLGNWQLTRAEEKTNQYELLQEYAKQPAITLPGKIVRFEDYRFREVEAVGEYVNEQTIYLDNKIYKGTAGYHIITPFRIKDSDIYLAVNRGWIAGGNDRRILPAISAEKGERKLTGTVISPEIRTLELSKQVTRGVVWDNFNLQRYQEISGLTFQPLLILQNKSEEDGLIRDWSKPDSGATKNFGYAVQWFSLALTTVIIFIVLNVKRKY